MTTGNDDTEKQNRVFIPVVGIQNPATTTDAEVVAQMIWAESRGEPYDGQVAVAWVVLNRISTGIHSDGTIRGTVTKPFQFAWKSTYPIQPQFVELAQQVMARSIPDPTNGATFFANYDNPPWVGDMNPASKIQIGNHRFWRHR